ncbi:MAG: Gfo/Idh/MocA family oxidoreductase [Bryobacterales bacterium]|nr:Gfo/Idh/MocA family oxidoreductase [Bryobacterales bacterium]
MANEIGRRSFVAAAMMAAPAVQKARGQSGKINVGWIGMGGRGYHCMNVSHDGNKDKVHVVSVCDTYKGNLARAKDRVQTLWGNSPKTTADYREILADPSVDAVFIMTPEHLHYPMMLAALKAKKHVYVEKPLAHTIEEGAELVKAARAAGKIVQVGTQNRSSKLYQRAKEMVAQGMIGDIHYVRAFWYRNSPNETPAWRYNIPADASPENTDWAKFLEGAPKREFDLRRYYQWRLYWDYSGGISTDLLVHQTDITNFVLGKTVPLSCVASGGIYRWTDANDDREVPDTFSAIYDYADKFHLNYSCYFGNDHYGYGEQFCGNEGTIEVLNRQDLHFYPQLLRGAAPAHVKARQEIHLNGPRDFGEPDGLKTHITNFIEAVRGNEKPVAPVEAGHQAAISGHLATLSFKNGRKVIWDEKTEKSRFA